MSEADLLSRIRGLFPRAGDDAAILGRQIVTNDMLVEDVDFTRSLPLRYVARKALAVNLSDLAAMGARPQYAVIALGIPEWVVAADLVDEIAAAASYFDLEVVGGDLSRCAKLVVSVTAIGEAERPLLRSTARPGDRLYVSRPLGGSPAGLHLLQHGWSADGEPPSGESFSYVQREFGAAAIRSHVDPEPEMKLGLELASMTQVTACLDISDGLSSDLHHLCSASGIGASVERARIPLFGDLMGTGTSLGVDVRSAVLNGGEEYALLFTSTLREAELSSRLKRPVYAIGRMTAETRVLLDGEPLDAHGWDHFAAPSS